MKKIITLLLVFLSVASASYAESLSKAIDKLNINKGAMSVVIKEVGDDKDYLYTLNPTTPMYPASTLKLITSAASIDMLESDYKMKTSLYKSSNNDLYLKLAGDPLFTSNDLEVLLNKAKAKDIEPKTVYIDDSIFDNVEWGEGWQWDDEFNPLMPKFSAYNINKNLMNIEVSPTVNKVSPKIVVKPFYPVSFMNLAVTDMDKASNITIEKNTTIATNMLNVFGSVSKLYSLSIPVFNPKLNFVLRLEEAMRSQKFEYYSQVKYAKLPKENVYLVAEVERNIEDLMTPILKNSDNLAAESLFKHAGAVWSKSEGSIENSLAMLDTYLKFYNLDASDIKIVDGSGVSKNNLMTAKFMVDFLNEKAMQNSFYDYKELLPKPGEGTLKNRMLYFKDNLKAKTGTLSDTSAIAGYIKTRRGKVLVFDIMINDPKTSSADKKNIEEQILRNIYLNN